MIAPDCSGAGPGVCLHLNRCQPPANRRLAAREYRDGRCNQAMGGCGDFTDRLDLNLQQCPTCAQAQRNEVPR